jgi:hypothetical protein
MDLNFIYTDKNYKELGFLKNMSCDLVIGKYGVSDNDFELTLSIADREPAFDDGSLFYCEDTEYGGIINHKKVNTNDNTITFIGKTFRGLLEKEYIQPPTDEAYLKLNDEANTCINTLIGNKFGGLFVVDDIGKSGINIKYDIRDLNLLQALEKALATQNCKLDIKHQDDGKVHLKAVKINDLSDTLQYDNNYQVGMIVQTKDKPYNHILALGKGELLERLRVNLYLQADGSWGTDEYYIGLNRKTYKHEDVNVDDEEELKSNAIEKINELNGSDTLDISFTSDNAELFDIVGAKENITNISFKQPITEKILKVSYNNLSISYKVGETN